MRVGVLEYDQLLGSTPRQFLAREDAERLASEFMLEKISNKLYRTFAPDSAFRKLQPTKFRIGKLGSGELPGLKFVGPRNLVPHFISNMGPNCPWDWSQEARA